MNQTDDNLLPKAGHELPHNLYRAEQVQELDRITIEEEGVPGRSLRKL